jgi:uncharacterized Tic20 family protein
MSNDLSQGAPSADVSSDDKNLAMLAHLLSILAWFIAPLIIWLLNKDKPEKEFVSDQAKEALNFQITIFIATFVSSLLTIIFIGFFLLLILLFVNVIFCIVAGIAASKGTKYRYPITLRLLS